MNPEAIQRVAQNMPSHMLQSLSAVASQTPHYPHTPGGAYGANTYINTVSTNIQTDQICPSIIIVILLVHYSNDLKQT